MENEPETTPEPAENPAVPGIEPVVSPTEGTETEATPIVVSNRGGAPRGNQNRARTGLRASDAAIEYRLMLGTPPKGCGKIKENVYKMRLMLVAAVEAAHGSLSVPHMLAIDTACKHERAGGLALKWLRDGGDKLTIAEKVALSDRIASSSEKRDKAVATLALGDGGQLDPWRDLDRSLSVNIVNQFATPTAPALPHGPTIEATTTDAQGDDVGNVEGNGDESNFTAGGKI